MHIVVQMREAEYDYIPANIEAEWCPIFSSVNLVAEWYQTVIHTAFSEYGLILFLRLGSALEIDEKSHRMVTS